MTDLDAETLAIWRGASIRLADLATALRLTDESMTTDEMAAAILAALPPDPRLLLGPPTSTVHGPEGRPGDRTTPKGTPSASSEDRAHEPLATAQHSYNDCDCVPGHRCDCWDYRPDPRLDALLAAARGHIDLLATFNYPSPQGALSPSIVALRDALAAFEEKA